MRSSRLKVVALVAAQLGLALVATPGWALFDEPQKAGEQKETKAANPEAQAALDAGLSAVKAAETLAAGGTPGKLSADAKEAYAKALTRFTAATKADPNLALAWNGVGYSSRKLGDYEAALAAYDKAIGLRAGYPEATEYRGEAYLALNRTEDAKQAYLDLFAANRELAGKLLEAMKQWAATPGKKKADVADLKDFIKERAQIAAQTASLTREAVSRGWN
jgi:tetratricopeptide (TPR) repeat protein